MTKKQNTITKHSESLKNKVKLSGINLIVIAQRSQITYPRLRELINGKGKLLYDEGIAIEQALKESVNVVQQS